MNGNSPLVERLLGGDRRALSRIISLVEDESEDSRELLHHLYPHTGGAYRIGLTGPPGAGKSTLAAGLARLYRASGLKVGVIAVDPTSPFTGGALLGDRVRMSEIELDGGIFIRSMATRGSLGGLSRKAMEAADVLDAAGFGMILIETVGVGQSELDIAGSADTTVVVLVPESGDAIQAMKAGLMEIADLFVVNKADRPGAEQAMQSIHSVLNFIRSATSWRPPVLRSVAVSAEGIGEIAEAIARHRSMLGDSGGLEKKRRERIRRRIRMLVDERFISTYWTPDRERVLDGLIDGVRERKTSPYEAAAVFFQGNP